MRTFTTLLGNSQKPNGGVMFGSASHTLRSRWIQPDVENRTDLGYHALLVRDGERDVLVGTGIGAFFPSTLCQRYSVQEERYILLDGLAVVGLDNADIDVMLLTHLHFDYAGGLSAAWEEDQPAYLLSPNACFVSGRRHWRRAHQPHSHDRASFVPELLDLLQASGHLELLGNSERSTRLGEGWHFHFSEGHIPGQMLPEIAMPGGPVIFSGDPILGAPWIRLPLTMGCDCFSEGLTGERERLPDDLIAHSGRLVFTHDPCVTMGRMRRDEQKRCSLYDTLERVESLEA